MPRQNPSTISPYVDQIYDGLLETSAPFVELALHAQKLASDPNALHPFWYQAERRPAKGLEQMGSIHRGLLTAFGAALREEEVANWYFEVWNEPNLDFWSGDPKEATYYELYDHTLEP